MAGHQSMDYSTRWLNDISGEKFFPVTHIKAVKNDDNVDLEVLLNQKQDNLVSGVNLKTINNNSILGSGNLDLEVPTKTSDLTNDSGFITSTDIPEGSAASTTSPLMDGVANVGVEMAFARGDHRHPSDTSKADVSATVSTVTYDTVNKKLTKTINGTTTDIVTAADLISDAGGSITDTKNTAGSTDTSDKIFLIGAKSQAANSQTYSHDTAYVGTDGCLYSNGEKVITSHQDISGKADSSTTLSGYGITDAKIENGVITLGNNTITPLTNFTEVDPIFSSSAASGITSTDVTNWNNKSKQLTWYGTSNTGATATEKIVSCSNFELVSGAIIGILFTTANTAASPTLNINSTGAKSIHIGNTTPNATTNVLKWSANTMLYFLYNGTQFKFITANAAGEDKSPLGASTWYGTSSSGETTAAKTSNIDNYILTQGSLITIAFSTANTYISGTLTLNINGTGAKNIYVNNAVTSASNNLTWSANEVLTFIYSGSYYYYVGKALLKTSQLLNDSGFITTSDIPEGAAASTTIPLMDGAAYAGQELAFARGDHRHPSDSTKADITSTVSSVNYDSTNHKITQTINGVTTDVVNVSTIMSDGNGVVGSNLNADQIILGDRNSNIKSSGKSIEDSTSTFSSTSDLVIPTSKAVATYVQNQLTSVLTYKGTVGQDGTVSTLPTDHKVGDVYVVKTSGNYAGQDCEAGDYIICNTTGTSANNSHWDVISGENQVENKLTSLASAGSSVVIATVDGTDITIGTPSGWTGVDKVGTITGITMNGSSKGNSGIIDLGTVITSHQDISGKADKATTLAGYGITDANISSGTITLGGNTITPLTQHQDISGKQDVISDLATIRSNAEAGAAKVSNVQSDWNATTGLAVILNKPNIPDVSSKQDTLISGTNIKTINNQSLLGSGNINVSGYIPIVNHGTSDTTYALTSGAFHIWDEITSLTLTLTPPDDLTTLNEYLFQFESGTTPTTLALPATVQWSADKGELIPQSGYIYQISIINNVALWTSIYVY